MARILVTVIATVIITITSPPLAHTVFVGAEKLAGRAGAESCGENGADSQPFQEKNVQVVWQDLPIKSTFV